MSIFVHFAPRAFIWIVSGACSCTSLALILRMLGLLTSNLGPDSSRGGLRHLQGLRERVLGRRMLHGGIALTDIVSPFLVEQLSELLARSGLSCKGLSIMLETEAHTVPASSIISPSCLVELAMRQSSWAED